MNEMDERWTRAHDLALLYLALAYGTDHRLNDEELEAITRHLQGWRDVFPQEAVQEVVLEAMAVYLSDEAERALQRAVASLKLMLATQDRRRVLEEGLRIAEADGVLLAQEYDLLTQLAEAWDLKAFGASMLEGSALLAERPAWSLMHDIGLMYLVMAHSTDNDLSDDEIALMIHRLQEWQPELDEGEVREVLREVLRVYSAGPDQQQLRLSLEAIRNALPPVQRLMLLNDLAQIAEVDGPYSTTEQEMLDTFSQAWQVRVRLNGQSRRLHGLG